MATGVLFTALVARHLLSPTVALNLTASGEDLREVYKLRERLFAVQLPPNTISSQARPERARSQT